MKSDYLGVMLEDVKSQAQRLAEAMADLPETTRLLAARLNHTEEEQKLMRGLWRDHEDRLLDLERQR